MKVTDLRVNHLTTPIGFQIVPLSFSWKVEEPGEGVRQKAARLTVRKGSENIYDSGKGNPDSLDCPADVPLVPRTRYNWSIEVTANSGEMAGGSSWFETGKMDEPWVGEWITADMDADTPAVLRKKFEVANPAQARLYICGLGVYEVYINGEKMGDEFLAPGYHSYDFHLQAQTYDVSEYVREGENEICIWLGDGWYRGRLGFDGGFTNVYGDRCYAIAELYAGGELVAKTDETWSSKESPVLFSNIYDGEIFDEATAARLEEPEGWKGVRLEGPKACGPLTDRYGLPIVKKEDFYVAERIRTPKGETVLDFGQELTGWVEFTCRMPAGMQIRLTASEILQDGCFYHENMRTAKTEFTYISNGEKALARPHFTFYGFRYMKVEYLDAEGNLIDPGEYELDDGAFTAYHLRSDFDQIGMIETGNEMVNQLFSNALWGQKDNFLDVPTDCPQRDERLGWTGDAQVFSETACYNMYMPAFYRKYLWDFRAEQSVIGGSGPNVVPRLKKGMVAEHGSCPWADAAVVIPWRVYEHYGSRTLLAECYPGMKAWVDCERAIEEKEEGPHLVKGGFHFADWLALDNPEPGPFGATDPLFIASAYYYRNAQWVAAAAGDLGYEEDAAEYGKFASEILAAIQDKYFDENGLCVCKTQTGSAIAVAFGLNPAVSAEYDTPEQIVLAEGAALNQRIAENNGHLNTGFVGTTILCPALTVTGHNDTAVDLLLVEDCPGWLYSVNMGATTIWERWNSVEPDGHMNPEGMNSLNHYSFGSIEAWMYKYVCGIQAAAPGFRQAVIIPHADARLGYAACVLDTAVGKYKSGWRCGEDGTVTYEVEVPFGAEAQFVTGTISRHLTAGTYTFKE